MHDRREMQKMEELPNYYTILFNASDGRHRRLDRHGLRSGRTLLVQGQQQAETAYTETPET